MHRGVRYSLVGAGALVVVAACSDGSDGGGSTATQGASGGGGRAGAAGKAGGGAGTSSTAGTGGTAGKGGAAGLGGSAGGAGKSGAAGAAGKGGSAGAAGKGGSAGAAGKGGSAGAAGKGGSAGAAGTAGQGGSAGGAGKSSGGSAGAAGAAGSSTCPGVDFGTVDACESCTAAACCAAATACVGEQACLDCWNGKTPAGCSANAAFSKLIACEQTSCAATCGACEFTSWTTPNTCTACLDKSCCTTLAGCFGSTACHDCWNGTTTTGCASVAGYAEAIACMNGPCASACANDPCAGKTDGFYCGLASDSRVLTECKAGVTGTTQTCANGCATATNSCATSNGFAGTEQAGRLTAGMSCDFFSTGTCGDCADTACCTAETDCFTNPECLALWNCHVPCTDDACVTACINQHPNGLSGAQGVYACMKSSCYGECGYAADDAYIRYVHAAPGAPGFDVCTRSKGATDWSNNNSVPVFGSYGDGNKFVYRSGASVFFIKDEGDYELRLVPAGSTNCLTPAPQYTGTFSFSVVRGHSYSVVVNWSPVEIAFIEDVPTAVAGQASFQLVNVITQVSTSMEVGRYSSGFTAIGTVPNNNYTQPITVAPFTQKLAFRRSGSGVGFIGSPSGEAIAAIAGSSHTVYLMGQSETGSPQAVMVVCDNDVYQPLFNTQTMSSGCHFTVPVY